MLRKVSNAIGKSRLQFNKKTYYRFCKITLIAP